MHWLFGSMPLWLYTLVALLVISLGVYGIIDLEKKKPGHPYKYVICCLFPAIISILLNRYVYEYTSSQVLMKVVDIISIAFVIIFFIVLGIATYLSNKYGYISEKGRRLLSSTLFPCIVVMILCMLVIAVLSVLRSNQ